MPLTHDDVIRILKIIDESDYDEVHVEIGDLKLHVSKGGQATTGTLPSAAPVQSSTPAPARAPDVATASPPQTTKPAEQERVEEGMAAVCAPMLGTFYRAPSPTEKAFVEVGDRVEAETTVCLVEVMKLFHSVKAGVAGTVRKIAVENGSMVEYGQVLLVIEPKNK